MRLARYVLGLCVFLFAMPAAAQNLAPGTPVWGMVVSSCGSATYTAGQPYIFTQDITGKLCDGGSSPGSAGYQPTPTGYTQFSAATLATSTPLNAPAGSNYCFIQPEGGAIRWLDFGTGSLSATNGQILTDGQPMIFSGPVQLAAVRIIAATYGGSAQTPIVNMTCEK